ncbi:flagellar FlbD family protein [Acidiferrimicrobium sp. IK]|uniref:flagellar FlbD family protein n=1 Tax=Acidiferrimicrobium sp. IK TaxID=2871700 RepID=UPI0021CB875B|nr:flagellar FlbD family protein [Acidiferrimicrobium sp. IK]MCU4185040.1 flagellar FlbD family protein [Acidiferrimicrobium sp. IK]
MILLTRFPKGDRLALNPDLIERAEALPDTVVTMTDSTRYVVEESVEELIEIIKEYRASILAMAQRYGVASAGPPPGSLRLVREASDAPEVAPAAPGRPRP